MGDTGGKDNSMSEPEEGDNYGTNEKEETTAGRVGLGDSAEFCVSPPARAGDRPRVGGRFL